MLHTTDLPAKIAYSVEELAEATSLSDAHLRNEIRDGKLKAKRVGRRVLILHRDVEIYLAQFENAAKA